MRFSSPARIPLLLAALLLTVSCGGGGGGPTDDGEMDPPLTGGVFYAADQDTNNVEEVYAVDLAAPGTSRKVNAPLRAGSAVSLEAVNSDLLLYATDHDLAGTDELYVVRFDTPGTVTRVNPPFPAGTQLTDVALSPNGRYVVYRADSNAPLVFELWLVDLTNPGVATRLNPLLGPGSTVDFEFGFNPAGNLLYFLSDTVLPGRLDLYVIDVPPTAPAVFTSDAIVAGGSVTQARFSADGVHILYVADQLTDEEFQLFRVALAAPGVSTLVNGALTPSGDVESFRITLDGQHVVYRADQTLDEQFELFHRPIDLSAAAVRLNGALANPAMQVEDYAVSPDSSAVLYRSSERMVGLLDIYLVPIASPGAPQMLNPPLAPGGAALFPFFNAPGTRIVYSSNADTPTALEVYVVDVGNPGVQTKVSGPLPAGSAGALFALFTQDGKHVVYMADEATAGVREGFAVPLDDPGASFKLNAPLVSGGNLTATYPLPLDHLLRYVN